MFVGIICQRLPWRRGLESLHPPWQQRCFLNRIAAKSLHRSIGQSNCLELSQAFHSFLNYIPHCTSHRHHSQTQHMPCTMHAQATLPTPVATGCNPSGRACGVKISAGSLGRSNARFKLLEPTDVLQRIGKRIRYERPKPRQVKASRPWCVFLLFFSLLDHFWEKDQLPLA